MTTEDPKSNKSVKSGAHVPIFEYSELQSMHRWCLKYRDLVRGGGVPTSEQDEDFLLFSRICYATGVAYG